MMKTIGKRKTILIAAVILLLTVSAANAALITIAVEGTIDSVWDPANHLEGKISAGDTIIGYYTYESTTPDSDPFSDGGEYWNYIFPSGIYLICNGLAFKTDTTNIEFAIGIVNDYYDRYQVNSFNNLLLPNGTSVNEIIWGLEDSYGIALSSDALPTNAPVLSDWEENLLNVNGGPRGAEFIFDAVVTSATVVPEPVTILFMLLGTGFLRRRIN